MNIRDENSALQGRKVQLRQRRSAGRANRRQHPSLWSAARLDRCGEPFTDRRSGTIACTYARELSNLIENRRLGFIEDFNPQQKP